MRIFSYIITSDSGFSPNPFWGYCTLACCKPVIRRTAEKGDFVIGISPRNLGYKVVYVMKITEDPVTFDEYFTDARFQAKIPDYRQRGSIHRRGDNIYKPIGNGEYRQLRSRHSLRTGAENVETKKRDLSGERVLISNQFSYFGREAMNLPDDLQCLIATRGHKCRFDESVQQQFLAFVKTLPNGVRGLPLIWPESEGGEGLVDTTREAPCDRG